MPSIAVVWVSWAGRRTVQVGAQQTLLEALLAAGLGVPHQCREARCGRCRVHVQDGASNLEEAGERERQRLGPALGQGMRLLCQARVRADPDLATAVVVRG